MSSEKVPDWAPPSLAWTVQAWTLVPLTTVYSPSALRTLAGVYVPAWNAAGVVPSSAENPKTGDVLPGVMPQAVIALLAV
jgi:hypothetical protein